MKMNITLSIIAAFVIAVHANATSLREPIKIFADAYLREQVKKQLAEYLNKNPQVVFSSNPRVGTQSMKFLSKAIAAYGFIKAESDKERAFAALQFFASDPNTAAILLTVQIVDIVATMEHQKDLAKAYERIAKTQMETLETIKILAVEELNLQLQILMRLQKAIESYDQSYRRLLQNPLYLQITQTESLSDSFDDSQFIVALHETIIDLMALETYRDEIAWAFRYVDARIEFEALELDPKLKIDFSKIIELNNSQRPRLHSIRKAFLKIHRNLEFQKIEEEISTEFENLRQNLNLYTTCIQNLNAFETSVIANESTEAFDLPFLQDCTTHYKLTRKFL